MPEHIKEWLQTKHTALWGRSFMITADDSLEAAAQWFSEQMASYVDFMRDKVSQEQADRARLLAPNVEFTPGAGFHAGAWDVTH